MAFRSCHSSSQQLCLVLLNKVAVLSMNLVITTMTLMMMVMVTTMMMMVVVFIHQGHVHSMYLVTNIVLQFLWVSLALLP